MKLLGGILLAFFLPMLVLGALWSGTIPLWPPTVSVSKYNVVIWAALFVFSYGIPLLWIGILLLKRGRLTADEKVKIDTPDRWDPRD